MLAVRHLTTIYCHSSTAKMGSCEVASSSPIKIGSLRTTFSQRPTGVWKNSTTSPRRSRANSKMGPSTVFTVKRGAATTPLYSSSPSPGNWGLGYTRTTLLMCLIPIAMQVLTTWRFRKCEKLCRGICALTLWDFDRALSEGTASNVCDFKSFGHGIREVRESGRCKQFVVKGMDDVTMEAKGSEEPRGVRARAQEPCRVEYVPRLGGVNS